MRPSAHHARCVQNSSYLSHFHVVSVQQFCCYGHSFLCVAAWRIDGEWKPENVNCPMLECSNHTKKKTVDENVAHVRFFSVPKVINNQWLTTQGLTTQRKSEWLCRIIRNKITISFLLKKASAIHLQHILPFSGTPHAQHLNRPVLRGFTRLCDFAKYLVPLILGERGDTI